MNNSTCSMVKYEKQIFGHRAKYKLAALFSMLLFFVSVHVSYAESIKPPLGRKSLLPPSSPEAVVDGLYRFDFEYGDRQDPEQYQYWLDLTTDGEPDLGKNAGYWDCQIFFIVRSYRILGKEQIAADRARIPVELDVTAVMVSAPPEALSKHIDKCYWPEQNLGIYDSQLRETKKLTHPLTATGFIGLISGKEMDGDFLSEYEQIKNEQLVFPVANERRRWQLKVDVVKRKGRWQILSELLPRPIISLKDEIEAIKYGIKHAQQAINVCSGALLPPSKEGRYYKQNYCPPASYPDEKLVRYSGVLNTLKTIQGEQK